MNPLNKLALAAATTAALAATTAYGGMTQQGPQLTGIALQSLESNPPAITAVTLPTGETVDLRSPAVD
jgi:hypothetical protein